MTAKYREADEREVAILSKLLHEDFPGVHELRSQVPDIKVRTIIEDKDNYGSIELEPRTGVISPVNQRVPVEAKAHDIDGAPIEVLLHVIDGKLAELEILRVDGDPIKRQPQASDFEVSVNSD